MEAKWSGGLLLRDGDEKGKWEMREGEGRGEGLKKGEEEPSLPLKKSCQRPCFYFLFAIYIALFLTVGASVKRYTQ